MSTMTNLRGGENVPVPMPRFRWGTRVVLPVAVLLGFAGLFAGSMAESLVPAVDVQAVPVVERSAVKRTAAAAAGASDSSRGREVLVQAAGWIEPDPFPVFASTLINGTVEEVNFLEGDAVAEGGVLVRLVADDARLALRRAEAELRAAEETWEANIAARREAAVAAAAVRETNAALELARAELDVQQALLREAQRVFRRREDLVRDGSISQEEHDTAKASAEAQAARVRVAEQKIHQLAAKLERMEAEEAAARQRLELRTEERRRVELARVARDEAQLRVDRLKIKAPMDGVIMRRHVGEGSILMAGGENPEMNHVAELYDPERLQVRVDVPLADAAQIGVGQPAQVTVEVLPDRTFTGTVTRVTNFADIQKNTLEVKVALQEPDAVLKPEMLARVRFLAMEPDGEDVQTQAPTRLSVFAPGEAVAGGAAWVVSQFDGEEGIAARRTVTTTGAESDGWMEIESGLLPGDLLIVSAEQDLQPQQRVRVRPQGGQ